MIVLGELYLRDQLLELHTIDRSQQSVRPIHQCGEQILKNELLGVLFMKIAYNEQVSIFMATA